MDSLDLLFERLVRSVRDTRPEFLQRPFEVAELIHLVPYGAVRAEGGFETNDDYAHALTRLLAGERGYLFADDLLQDDLKAELASPNPDLSAYRAYVTARISLSQEHARRVGESMPPAAHPLPAAEVEPHRAPADTPRPVRAAAPPALDPEAHAAPIASRPGCRYCGETLPDDRPVHFCPACGQNLLQRRCAACSAELEPNWKFCVACGRLAGS